ncbi:hypothetical protein ACIBI9_62475 [Nonomuraea sp. NPDC050451]|uniref:nSTAND1 domain-containing NTPase n=1 Tax=Nonomuraea sp. NPDC050451 TaxID=3364364 RepID=UPI0037A038A2
MADTSRTRPADDEARQMRAGIRLRIVRDARRAGQNLRRISPPAFVALLCAAALAPVVAAVGTSTVGVVGIGVLGSVGANVLTEVVTKAIDRLRGDARNPASVDVIERELSERLQAALTSGEAEARTLRSEIAAVLEAVGGIRTAIEAAVETDDEGFQADLADMLTGLSVDFAEFGFVLRVVRDTAFSIQEMLRLQDAKHRADRERLRDQAISLQLIHEKVSLVERRTRAARDAGPDEGSWSGDCPYRGLWPFESEHAEVFYGRERLTAELVGKVAEALDGLGMVVVTGASGAGKSSLLRAGLIPALARGALLPGSEDWPRLLITPTRSPVQELAMRLAALGGMDAIAVHDGLTERPEQAYLLGRQAVLAHGSAMRPGRHDGLAPAGAARRLVLVVDQFEEVFALAGETSAETFITALTAMSGRAAGGAEPAALVVLGVRGDYWARCAAHPRLAGVLREGHFLVGPMSESELRRAVSGPAKSAGLKLEAGLVDAILSDLRSAGGTDPYEVGALPLLSQAMLITWENREGDCLTNRAYGVSGGIAQAVQSSADGVYHALTPEGRAVARDMITQLVSVTAAGRTTRRRARRADLRQGDLASAVLAAFTAKRLVILQRGTVELAHDVLLRAWPRLRGWLREEETDHVLHHQLLDDAEQWELEHRDASFLYRGTQLTTVREAASRWTRSGRYPALAGAPLDFLDRSRATEDRRRRNLRLSRGTLALLLAVVLAAGGFAAERSSSAARQNDLRIARQTAARADATRAVDPVRAMLLSVAAWRLAPHDLDTIGALYGSLAQREAHVLRPAAAAGADHYDLSRDGTTLAVVNGGRLSRWDVASGRRLPGANLDLGPEVTSIALSPDGATLAVGSEHSVRLWDPRTGEAMGRPFGKGGAERLGFNASGTVLTGQSTEGGRSWKVTDRKRPLWTSGADLALMEVSPGGTRMVRAHDLAPYELFDAHRKPLPPPGGAEPVRGGAAAFAPDGTTLAVSTGDQVRFWDLRRHQWKAESLAVTAVRAIAFSGNGAYVATYDDEAVTLWRSDGFKILTRSAREVLGEPRFGAKDETLTYLMRNGEVVQLDIAALTAHRPLMAGARIGALDPLARTALLHGPATVLTDARPPPSPGPRTLNVPPLKQAAFSRDGRSVATVAEEGAEAVVWDVETATPRRTLSVGPTTGVGSIALNRDGSRAAIAPFDGARWQQVQLWDVRRGTKIETLDQRGHMRMEFSPDDRLLAVNGPDDNGLVRLSPRVYQRWLFGKGGQGGRSLAISPDSTIVAAGGPGYGVDLWDAAAFRHLGHMRVPEDEFEDLTAAAFSPDGHVLAAGGASGHVRLWNVADGRVLGAPLLQHAGRILALAFTADGGALHSVGTDGALRVLAIDPERVADEVCARARTTLDEIQWRQLIGEADYRKVC